MQPKFIMEESFNLNWEKRRGGTKDMEQQRKKSNRKQNVFSYIPNRVCIKLTNREQQKTECLQLQSKFTVQIDQQNRNCATNRN
ncbi:uncharacterized protein DS421_14g452290 [Arachis hypogaea]|nr:uncharacterized protein DS421_14g452290 [Arachis hypogaea]